LVVVAIYRKNARCPPLLERSRRAMSNTSKLPLQVMVFC